MSSVGRWYSIRCYKHNGALHRVWDRGLVLENTEDYLVIATKKAKVIEANGRSGLPKNQLSLCHSDSKKQNLLQFPSFSFILDHREGKSHQHMPASESQVLSHTHPPEN